LIHRAISLRKLRGVDSIISLPLEKLSKSGGKLGVD